VLAAPLDFERPHGGIDADLSIGDAEEAVVSPRGVPAVLADPVPPGIIIANATDAMTAFQNAADMVIDAAVVAVEIRIYAETGYQGATSREPLTPSRSSST
jgi:hypothetical protein